MESKHRCLQSLAVNHFLISSEKVRCLCSSKAMEEAMHVWVKNGQKQQKNKNNTEQMLKCSGAPPKNTHGVAVRRWMERSGETRGCGEDGDDRFPLKNGIKEHTHTEEDRG